MMALSQANGSSRFRNCTIVMVSLASPFILSPALTMLSPCAAQLICAFQGACVRINPGEVHIDGRVDPAFWDVIYSHSNKLDKDQWYYDGFGSGASTVSTGPADLHRVRRAAMSNYFSSTNLRKHEPMILRKIEQLCGRLESCRAENKVVDISSAYSCLTGDIVTSFAIPEPQDLLSEPDFARDFHRQLRFFANMITYHRHLLFVFPLILGIPDWLMVRLDTSRATAQQFEFQRSYERQVKIAVDRQGVPPDGHSPSILDAVVRSPELAQSDKKVGRVLEEARNTVGAGTETTASTLTAMTYYVLANPSVFQKLKKELHKAADGSTDLLDLKTLDRLPYLQACINETLRIRAPVTGRLPRVNPRAAMTYTDPTGKSYTFPPGTVISMTATDMHYNTDVFPEPDQYRPERWIRSLPEAKAKMQQCFVPFGKGTRGCIGIELARMEMTLTSGNLFNKYEFELFETTARDVSYAENWFSSFNPPDSKGVRILVK